LDWTCYDVVEDEKCWIIGILERWNIGILERWNIGILEY
jgi:hypothetical protein